MKISICGSMYFMEEMNQLADELIKFGFKEVFKPVGMGGNEKELKEKITRVEDGNRKIEFDLINEHWKKILRSDCGLIANYDKNGVKGYIGGNTFLEMGFAFVTGKPIFLLNPIPEMSYSAELQGMRPIVINNNIDDIKRYYTL